MENTKKRLLQRVTSLIAILQVRRSEDAEATVLSGGETPVHAPKSVNELGKLLEGSQLGDYRLEKFVGGGVWELSSSIGYNLNRTLQLRSWRDTNQDEEMLKRSE